MTEDSVIAPLDIVSEVPLEEYLNNKSNTQTALALAVGCHQTAISRLLREKRGVTVVTYSDKSVELREVKIIAKSA